MQAGSERNLFKMLGTLFCFLKLFKTDKKLLAIQTGIPIINWNFIFSFIIANGTSST